MLSSTIPHRSAVTGRARRAPCPKGAASRKRGWKVATLRTPSISVNLAARGGERLAGQCASRGIAEQQQPLGLCQRDMVRHQLGAALERVGVELAPRAVEAGERGDCRRRLRSTSIAASILTINCQAVAADRLAIAGILARRELRHQHDFALRRPCGRIRRAPGRSSGRPGAVARARREMPPSVSGDCVGAGASMRRDNRARALGFSQSRGLSLIGRVNAGVQPPAEQARRFGAARLSAFPRPWPTFGGRMVDAAVKESGNWRAGEAP